MVSFAECLQRRNSPSASICRGFTCRLDRCFDFGCFHKHLCNATVYVYFTIISRIPVDVNFLTHIIPALPIEFFDFNKMAVPVCGAHGDVLLLEECFPSQDSDTSQWRQWSSGAGQISDNAQHLLRWRIVNLRTPR